MARKHTIPSSADIVPDVLKSRKQWVNWKYERKEDGSETKIPYVPFCNERSSSTDPSRWGTFEEAYETSQKIERGIGYVITSDDNITGIDLDDVIGHDGSIVPWVADIIAHNETYAEVSPSGSGIRIFALSDGSSHAEIEHNEGIEIYHSHRFLTITGNVLPGVPTDIKSAPKTLSAIRARMKSYKSASTVTAKSDPVRGTLNNGKMPYEEIKELLDYVSAASLHRMDWLKIVFAIHSETGGSSEGMNIADAWSSNDKRYKSGEVASIWNKSSPNRGVTIASLVKEAKDNGANVSEIARKHRPAQMATYRWDMPSSSNDWVSNNFGEGEHKASSVFDALPGLWIHEAKVSRTSDYLIKNIIGRSELAMIYGPSHTGKTYVTIDLAYNIATGNSVLGQRVRQAPVLYLSAEGGISTINRLVAVRNKYNDDTDDSQLYFVHEALNIYGNEEDMDKIRAAIDYAEEHIGKRFGLIVVDTLSRSTPGMDENSGVDTTKFIDMMDTLRNSSGCTILLVHHTGKDASQGARGHSSLRGAVDTELMLTINNEDPDNPHRVLKLAKSRNGSLTDTSFRFDLDSVDLGVDDEGDSIESAVVRWETYSESVSDSYNVYTDNGGVDPEIIESFKTMVNEAPEDNPYTMSKVGRYIVRALSKHIIEKTGKGNQRSLEGFSRKIIEDWIDRGELLKDGSALYFKTKDK